MIRMLKSVLMFILDWTWCFPQNLVGLFIRLFIWKRNDVQSSLVYAHFDKFSKDRCVHVVIKDIKHHINTVTSKKKYLYSRLPHLVFGRFIFIKVYHDMVTVRHDYGHVIQSRILGPFYFIVVGIPILINKLLKRTSFDYFPESWADRLGDIVRIDNNII